MRATYLWQAGAAVTRCCRQQHIKTFTMSCTNASASYRSSATFVDYVAPSWANRLKCIPKQRVQLAMYNTPIHAWNIPGVPSDFQLSVKRDDLSGSTLSGNKVRKLEFLMADAANQQCTSVITAGGIQSNFARSTAVAARQVGMDCHLFLRSEISEPESIGCEGNLLLDRMVGAHIYLIPKKAQYERDIKVKMEKLAAKIEEDGGKAYCVPVGGSNAVGLFGYLEGFNELIQQNVLEDFDDLVFTTGSGGTAAGLAIGNYLTGSKLKCHAIAVCDDASYFHAHINKTLQEVGLGSETKSEDILDILEGAKGKGYGVSTDEELDFIVKVGTTTGIMIDPVYTGKAVKYLVEQMNNTPSIFKGRRVLFVHTGGLFGLFDGRIDHRLKQAGAVTNQIHNWMDPDSPVP